MKNKIKEIISMFVAVVLMASICPLNSFINARSIENNLLKDGDIQNSDAEVVVDSDNKVPQTGFGFAKRNENIIYNSDTEFITYRNEAYGGESTGEIQYEITGGKGIAVINGAELSIRKAGVITVKATHLGDEQYKDAVAVYTLTVSKGQQKIYFDTEKPENVYYGQAVFENKAYGYEYGEGKITYSVISGHNIAKVNKNTGELTFQKDQTGIVEVRAVRESCDRFFGAEATYQITVAENELPEEPYIINGEQKNESGWYTDDIKIVPADGYQIGTSNDMNAEFHDSLTIDTEGKHNGTTIYLKKDNKITVGKTIDDSDLKLDKSGPEDLRIEYSAPVNNSVWDNIMYGFYYNKVIVTIYATDDVSGIENIQWKYTREEGSSETNLVSTGGSFKKEDIEYDGDTAKVSFTLTANEAYEYQYRGSISITAADTAGNCSSLDENGANKDKKKMVVVDNISPTRTITFSEAQQVVDAKTLEPINKYDYSAEGNYKLLYNKKEKDGKPAVQATIEITEANFYPEDVEIEVNDTAYKNISWSKDGDKWTGVVNIDKSGDYRITVNYMDRSNNKMTEYISPQISIDYEKPVINVEYDNNKSHNGKYFNQTRTAYITIKEHNFRAEDIDTLVIAKDVTGKDVNVPDYASYLKDRNNWTTEGDEHKASIIFNTDAQYDFVINYADMMGNYADTYDADSDTELTENDEISQDNTSAFVIDKMIPDNIKITYSQSKMSKLLEAVTFGYYNPKVTVTITADDIISGVDYIKWYYNREESSSSKNVESINGKVETQHIVYSEDKKTAQVSFTLTAGKNIRQYRGKISVVITDRAGNRSDKITDDSNIIVVDRISPTRTVKFSRADQVVNASSLKIVDNYNMEGSRYKLYYQKKATVTFSIDEVNFYPEDIIIKVDGKETAPANWKNVRDDIYEGSITLGEEGHHRVTMSYTDRSGNRMVSYVSNEIIIDKTKPIINVSYSPDNVIRTVKSRKYYDEKQTATIKIIEHNFRPDDVEAVITAKDVTGKDVNVADYAKYLKDRNSWKKDGDVYTAKITYSKDANYTFDISYKDMSGRSAPKYEQDKFTVDKSKPKNLRVSYSTNVFENILNSVSYNFYNAQMTVTIRADDNTSGIRKFVYSYENVKGVSKRNAEQIDKALSTAKITYINGGKTAVAKFTIPRNTLTQDSQFRGTVSFTASDHSDNFADKEEKKTVVVDNIAPQGTVTLNEPVAISNGISYYTGNITATIKIKEANFYPEDVSIKVNGSSVKANNWTQSGDNWTGIVTISGDGPYQLNVDYKDRSQNKMKSYMSKDLTIDSQRPSITVKGIKNASANKQDKIGFSIVVMDENLNASSFQAILTAIYRTNEGIFKKKNIDIGKPVLSSGGKINTYTMENIKEDAFYTLQCKTEDQAGNFIDTFAVSDSENKYTDTMSFSVNRKGSVFMLEDYAKEVSEQFYNQKVESDIKIVETNVDPLQEYHVELNKKELTEGTEYTVKKTKGSKKWYKYEYIINAELFKKEGNYSIIISSVDKARTKAYSDIKNAKVNFVVDETAPVITASGMEKNGRYQTESQTVTIIPTDDGGKLSTLRVEVRDRNGNLKETPLDLEGAELEKALEQNESKLIFQLTEGVCQNVDIICTDKAGNSYCSKETFHNITVSPSSLVIFWADIFLRACVFIGSIVITGGIIVMIIKKRKS